MVDGDVQGYGSREDVHGLRRYSLDVDLPPGGVRTVIFDLAGRLEPGPTYRLQWYNQPLPNEDRSRVIVDPVGTTLADGSDQGSVEVGTRRVEHLSIAAEK